MSYEIQTEFISLDIYLDIENGSVIMYMTCVWEVCGLHFRWGTVCYHCICVWLEHYMYTENQSGTYL